MYFSCVLKPGKCTSLVAMVWQQRGASITTSHSTVTVTSHGQATSLTYPSNYQRCHLVELPSLLMTGGAMFAIVACVSFCYTAA